MAKCMPFWRLKSIKTPALFVRFIIWYYVIICFTTGAVPVKGCIDCAGKEHKPGDSYISTDGCNICMCRENGPAGCSRKACNFRKIFYIYVFTVLLLPINRAQREGVTRVCVPEHVRKHGAFSIGFHIWYSPKDK